MSLEDRRGEVRRAFEAARKRLESKAPERAEPVKAPLPPRMVFQPKKIDMRQEREAAEAEQARERAGEKRQSILDEIGKKREGLTLGNARDDFDRSR